MCLMILVGRCLYAMGLIPSVPGDFFDLKSLNIGLATGLFGHKVNYHFLVHPEMISGNYFDNLKKLSC